MEDRPFFLREDLESAVSSLDQRQQTQVLDFANQGYLVVDPEIDEIDAIAEQLSGDALRYEDEGRIQDAWRTNENVRRLALDQAILETLELLYGRKAFAFQTLNFPVGTQQMTHSDTIHFSSTPADFMAGVWIALEDMDAENGPLHYYPGSHRLPHLTMDDLGVSGWEMSGYSLYAEHYEPAIQKIIEDRSLRKEQAHIRKGQALIWSANLLHGGDPIVDTNRSRHSHVTHYFFRGCRYWTPLHSGSGKTFRRCPYNIATGTNVTRLGEFPISEFLLRRIPGLA